MPTEPTVCCVLLTRDRPEMARRAVECFRAQTYEWKHLLIYDTNSSTLSDTWPEDWHEDLDITITESAYLDHHGKEKIIPYLRNRANAASGDDMDILIHFDDDDYSHPNRIAEQVALLQASGAECVGYREMLFWHEDEIEVPLNPDPYEPKEYRGGAWIYSNPDPRYCLGTSLCYWRSVWERRPFPEMNGRLPRTRGEDREWLREARSEGAHAVLHEPRMIARIHAGNAQHYVKTMLDPSNNSWKRAPEWDERVRRIMEG